ncbi:MAG TPA: MFS transporter [Pirellulales bacterium]|jgi:MFS family permease|nr:MFS transporter [Pirellulales bacterium]
MSRQILGLSVLFGTLSFIQGLGEPTTGLVTQPVLSMLKQWGLNAREIATFVALLGLPWCLKPLCGLLSDFVPLAGYRRKSYLVLATLAASLCFLLLYLLPLSAGARNLLFAALLLPALAITISDVVLDALMVEAGQSLRITGWLQSICCGASYLATLLTGVWGGSLTEERQQQLGFLMCGLLTAVTLLLAVVYVREPRDRPCESGFRPATKAVRESLRSPGVLAVGLFLFAWHFNPFSQSVLYLHMTGALHFSERSYGHTVSIIAIGSIAACVFYGLCCRRIPMRWLAPVSIVSGMLSTLTYYWPMADGASAAWVSMLAGFTYMMASMVLLDLAARACPVQAAGTVFAMFMALCNISAGLSTWFGGYCYEAASAVWGSALGFDLLLAVSAGFTGLSWLAARRLPRELLA